MMAFYQLNKYKTHYTSRGSIQLTTNCIQF